MNYRNEELTRITLKDLRNDLVFEVAPTISPDDWAVFEKYLAEIRQLERAELVLQRFPFYSRMSWTSAGFQADVKLPEWSIVEAFLHRFRPIILQAEITNFYRVRNLVCKCVPHRALKDALDEELSRYQGKLTQAVVTIVSCDTILNSEQTLMLYLNAFEYHRDEAKRKALEAIHWTHPVEKSRWVFIWLLQQKCFAAFRLGEIVRQLIESRAEIKSEQIRCDLVS